jgi:hypothetical protein
VYKNLADFQTCFYGHVSSLSDVDEQDIYTVSGLNSAQQPISIEWNYTGVDDLSSAADANNVVPYASGDCLPVVIACYSLHIDITAGRNVQFYS